MTHWELYIEPEINIDDIAIIRFFIPPCHQARTSNIETTAYALLIQAVREDVTAGLDIIKWLVRQRNSQGGFGSTQVMPL